MKLSHISILILFALVGCVDLLNLSVSGSDRVPVVDGMITNEPGPYTVKLFWSSNVGDILAHAPPMTDATVTLFDDQGASETLQEKGRGIYQTNSIQGEVGRTYHLEFTSPDGQHYSSKPELLAPAGSLDSLYFQFIQNEAIQAGVAVPNNGFNMYVNAKGNNGQSLLRWTWSGTYEVLTHPELATVPNTGMPGLPPYLAAPLACSGYISPDLISIQKVNQCTCCQCWVEQFQSSPVLSNNQFVANENYQRLNIAYIPANPSYFFNKYYFEVQQLSVSQNTFEFWKLIQSQQSLGTNLFQPPIAKVVGNIVSSTAETQALGVFSACGILRRSIWLSRSDIPYTFPDPVLIDDCTQLSSSSSNLQPSFWR